MGRGFYSVTLQLRKRHDSLELDGSQMGKLRPREEVICSGPIFSPPSSHPAKHRGPQAGWGMLTWVAF